MPYVSPKGRIALGKVAEWLEAGAPHKALPKGLQVDSFNMSYSIEVSDCGTSCCIAGAVCQFEALGVEHRSSGGSLGWTGENGVMELAGAFLGMELADQVRLFEPWNHFSHWANEDFNEPARGAAVIRYFLATGKVDWDRFNSDGTLQAGED